MKLYITTRIDLNHTHILFKEGRVVKRNTDRWPTVDAVAWRILSGCMDGFPATNQRHPLFPVGEKKEKKRENKTKHGKLLLVTEIATL